MRVLFHTSMSIYIEAEIINEQYVISVNENMVSRLMEELRYNKQLNQKTIQLGERHPDWNKQFEFINSKARNFMGSGLPIISVYCKKKENMESFRFSHVNSLEPHMHKKSAATTIVNGTVLKGKTS